MRLPRRPRARRAREEVAGSAPDPEQTRRWAEALAAGTDPAQIEAEARTLGPTTAGGVRGLGKVAGEGAVELLGRLARAEDRVLAAAALDALGDIGVVEAAEALGDLVDQLADKGLRTAARRAAHRLTARGIRPGPRAAATGLAGVGSATLYRAIASAYDGTGTRSFWLAAERPLGGAYRILLATNDTTGLIDCIGRDTTRKRIAEQEATMREQDHAAWVELPLDYARQLVQEAVDLARGSGHAVPTPYTLWAPMIGEPPARFQEALVYQEINAFEAKMHPTWLREAPGLFEQPEIEPWFFLPEQVSKWAQRLAETPTSRLVITPETEEGRHGRLLREAIADLLPPPALHGLRRRLEETAYIFLRTERDLEARRAVAAAVTIEDERPLRPPHPFLRVLMERSMEIALRVERSGTQPPRLTRVP